MTVREKLEGMLIANGMYEQQAKEVIDLSIPLLNQLTDNYKIQFESQWYHYDYMLYNLWYMNIKPIALKWIDENKPNAWFRDIFL